MKPKVLKQIEGCRNHFPSLPIIGVGGILSSQDAKAFFKKGANLIQCFTGLVYKGPWLIRSILKTLL